MDTTKDHHYTKKLVVDARDILLRLHCHCGAAVSVVPAKMKAGAFFCSNCGDTWPDAVDENRVPKSPTQRLAVALRDLQNETATGDYRVQFEVDAN